MERPTCETCPFWDVIEKDEWGGLGFCRRSPPLIPDEKSVSHRGIEMVTSAWPITVVDRGALEEADWCGEHPDFPAYLVELKLNRVACITPPLKPKD